MKKENKKLYDFLINYDKKTIDFKTIEIIFPNIDYSILYNVITDFIQNNFLIPFKNSIYNGRYPELPIKYRINIKIDTSDLLKYHSKIDISYYQKNMTKYNKEKKVIEIIDSFLKSECKNLLSTRERAFELFNNEKAFDKGSEILKILKNIKIDLYNDLNTFQPREPFSYFIFKKNISKVLISENQSPFYDFYLLNKENIKIFDAVIYGQGNRILKSFDFVLDFMEETTEFYYWGDIDYKGLEIFFLLKERFKENKIFLWNKAYNYMINNGSYIETKKNYNCNKFKIFFNDIIIETVSNGLKIPQEVITIEKLRNFKGVNNV